MDVRTYLAALGCDGEPAGDLRRRHLLDLEADGVQHGVKLRRLIRRRRRLTMIHGRDMMEWKLRIWNGWMKGIIEIGRGREERWGDVLYVAY